MDAHSVNSSKKIVWVGNNPNNSSDKHDITKVVYCDSNRTTHLIWPCTARLTDIYLVKLSTGGQNSDVSYSYTVDSQTLQPNVLMMPETVYSIKGTIETYKNGVLQSRIKDCYFFPETVSTNLDYPAQVPFTSITGNEAYSYGGRIATEIDANGNSTGTTYSIDYSQYTKWSSDSNPAHTGRMELQLGWWQPGVGYVQNGYIFDQNYVSRLILKRAPVSSIFMLFTHATNTGGGYTIGDGATLTVNTPITVWPKTRYFAQDIGSGQSWEKYELQTISNITYDNTVFNIVANNDGSYTITPISEGNNTSISFDNEEYDFVIQPEHDYAVYYGNHNAAGTISNLTASRTFYIMAQDWDESQGMYGTEYRYTGTYSMTSSNSSVVSCSGLTITPVSPGTSTITIKVPDANGRIITQFNVTVVGSGGTFYYQLSSTVNSNDWNNVQYTSAHPSTELNNNCTETTNCYDVTVGGDAYFAIKFSYNSNMTSPASVYIDTDGESALTNSNGDNVDVMGDGESEIGFGFRKLGSDSSYNFSVDIPVYSDVNLQNQIGLIHINMWH